MFKRILIANRGEIACRVARTCRALGVEYVAVYSEADSVSPHLDGATVAVPIGAGPALQSYLDGERIIETALQTGCEAIHPGYGFLSENSVFAAAVQDAGLVFIGPRPETIDALGDKARAKALMRAAGVPVVPGDESASDDLATVERMVTATGFPVLLKPSGGGGGKGMQVVNNSSGMRAVIESAIRVARNSFGDGRLLVERFIDQPRHIEVQVFGDAQGNVVHLFERECSLQRRHQKVVEEAPASTLPPEVRQRLVEAAVRGASSVGYLNAGTFEFIVGEDNDFYFLEVNTRLQVEHPVTECVTGLDLVEWQLRVAAGEPLPLSQSGIQCQGFAVECRLYAEDPADNFAPAPGAVAKVEWPKGVRTEAGLKSGGTVPPYYDPMVAKLVAHADTRLLALEQMGAALDQTVLLGLTTNIGYLSRVLAHPAVREARIHTRFLDEEGANFISPVGRHHAAAAAALADTVESRALSPWGRNPAVGLCDRASLDVNAPYGRLSAWLEGVQLTCALIAPRPHGFHAVAAHDSFDLQVVSTTDDCTRGFAGTSRWIAAQRGDVWEVQLAGDRYVVHTARTRTFDRRVVAGAAVAPMSGAVVAISVNVGDTVAVGDVLAVIEAMKMEHSVIASVPGTVNAIAFAVGESVKEGDLLVDVVGDA